MSNYTEEFEKVGELSIGDHIRQTRIISENITEYEHYINAIYQDVESEDANFNGCILRLNTLQFNVVERFQYGNGCDLKHQNIYYRGKNCHTPSNGYCSIK